MALPPRLFALLLPLCMVVAPAAARAADAGRCPHYEPLRTAWFGDLHVHTGLSLDAAVQGTRIGPLEAYRFARGEAIAPLGPGGAAVVQPRPLDFAAVTDHAETLGTRHLCGTPGVPGYGSLLCRGLRRFPRAVGPYLNYLAARGRWPGLCGPGGEACLSAAEEPWAAIRAAAELAQDRSGDCRFTSFIGYEWTGAGFLGAGRVATLHRNILFASAAVPPRPISFLDAATPTALYDELDRQCGGAGTGCEALSIPHNANLSLGQMYLDESDEDAGQRARYERLFEIVQHKGASECYFGAGATAADEFCGFEQLPWDSVAGNTLGFLAQPPGPAAGFARDVLLRGLAIEARTGVNPWQFGFVGSTDSHRGLAGATAETAFPGHGGAGTAGPEADAEGLPDQWEFNPGGLAVLYAEQNSRASLFAAMRRREAYATSGTRLQVRFFGGGALPLDLCSAPDFVDRAYRRAVPMGGRVERSARPLRFALSASRDPGTAAHPGNGLQRLQIIKGWLDGEGRQRQRVYEVAGEVVGGVDPATCEATAAGFNQLCTVWEDPDFQPEQAAYYYARVLETPSCRWSARVCLAQGVDCSDPGALPAARRPCCDAQLPRVIQERAWTSPIWYQPRAEVGGD